MSSTVFALDMDSQGRLVLKRPDQEDVVDIRIRRSFPWSNPNKYVSIRNSEGKELLLLDNLDNVPEPAQKTIKEYLEKWSFVPKITRVLTIDLRFGFQQWTVETDRGPMNFRVQEREDIRFLGDGRFSIKDVDGCIYELPAIQDLDEKSQRAIEVLV